MRTRTRLTTPPGQEPALSATSRPDHEVYVPGPSLPEEPRVPGRYRRRWTTVVVVAALVVLGYVAFRVMTAGQTFDPSLDPGVDAEVGADTADPTPPSGDTLPDEG